MPPKAPKADRPAGEGLTDKQHAELAESKRLQQLAQDIGVLSKSRRLHATELQPSKVLLRADGKDIYKKSSLRKGRYLLVLNVLLAPAAAGKLGTLAQLDSKNPVLYLDFPTGRLKLFGTLVFPRNKYLSLRVGAQNVLLEDTFESMVVFSEAWWVGRKEDNPSEKRLPMPPELQTPRHEGYTFATGAGMPPGGAPANGKGKPAGKEAAAHAPEDDNADGTTPQRAQRTSARMLGKRPRYTVPGSDDELEDEADDEDDDELVQRLPRSASAAKRARGAGGAAGAAAAELGSQEEVLVLEDDEGERMKAGRHAEAGPSGSRPAGEGRAAGTAGGERKQGSLLAFLGKAADGTAKPATVAAKAGPSTPKPDKATSPMPQPSSAGAAARANGSRRQQDEVADADVVELVSSQEEEPPSTSRRPARTAAAQRLQSYKEAESGSEDGGDLGSSSSGDRVPAKRAQQPAGRTAAAKRQARPARAVSSSASGSDAGSSDDEEGKPVATRPSAMKRAQPAIARRKPAAKAPARARPAPADSSSLGESDGGQDAQPAKRRPAQRASQAARARVKAAKPVASSSLGESDDAEDDDDDEDFDG